MLSDYIWVWSRRQLILCFDTFTAWLSVMDLILIVCCRSTMAQLGLILSEEDIHAMMKSVGIGPHGKISYPGDFYCIYSRWLFRYQINKPVYFTFYPNDIIRLFVCLSNIRPYRTIF